jgi:hypothetical protein
MKIEVKKSFAGQIIVVMVDGTYIGQAIPSRNSLAGGDLWRQIDDEGWTEVSVNLMIEWVFQHHIVMADVAFKLLQDNIALEIAEQENEQLREELAQAESLLERERMEEVLYD